MKYEEAKVRIEELEDEDVVTGSLTDGGETDGDGDEDPWVGGDNVEDSWW